MELTQQKKGTKGVPYLRDLILLIWVASVPACVLPRDSRDLISHHACYSTDPKLSNVLARVSIVYLLD